jgi:hypothetical protein
LGRAPVRSTARSASWPERGDAIEREVSEPIARYEPSGVHQARVERDFDRFDTGDQLAERDLGQLDADDQLAECDFAQHWAGESTVAAELAQAAADLAHQATLSATSTSSTRPASGRGSTPAAELAHQAHVDRPRSDLPIASIFTTTPCKILMRGSVRERSTATFARSTVRYLNGSRR